MKRSAMLFSLFLGAIISTPASLLAMSCGPQSFGKMKLHIEGDKLLVEAWQRYCALPPEQQRIAMDEMRRRASKKDGGAS